MPVLPDWISFHFPTMIHFEIDGAAKIGSFIKKFGNRIVVISNQKEMNNTNELGSIKSSIESTLDTSKYLNTSFNTVRTSLSRNTDGFILYDDIENTPTFKDLNTAAHFVRQAQANCIVAYGSFESINTAKAISLLAPNDMFAEEMFLQKKEIKNPPIPLIVVPTNPVMGMECSPFCIIAEDKDKRTRRYYANPNLFPKLVVADPKLTSAMTASDIIKSSVSILAVAVETILSKYANEITNACSLKSIELVAKNIIPTVRDQKNMNLRSAILAGSLLAGMSQSVSSMGLCFALSLACISRTKIDIFQAMSVILPHVMDYNLTASAVKFKLVAKALDEDTSLITVIEAAIKAVEGIRKIYNELKLPQKLSEYEVKKSDLGEIAALCSTYPFLDSLPKELPKNEIETILLAAF